VVFWICESMISGLSVGEYSLPSQECCLPFVSRFSRFYLPRFRLLLCIAHILILSSKDTTIRVWNRSTLELHRIMRGHEGPVNAVGMEDGRVVSASGDGKMILWDVKSGERLRTFEGHDRGLACIEYKVRLASCIPIIFHINLGCRTALSSLVPMTVKSRCGLRGQENVSAHWKAMMRWYGPWHMIH